MNLLFLTSPAPDLSPFSTKEKRPPLGLGNLMALARRSGYGVSFVDCYLQPHDLVAEGYFDGEKVDVVALYLNTVCLNEGLELLDTIHKAREEGLWSGPILVGGPHTSVDAQSLPSFIDHIVVGEGEVVFFDIIEGREHERIVHGRPFSDLDHLPFQPWDLFDNLGYQETIPWVTSGKAFALNTSRGCPFQCTFCSVKSVWGKTYRYQSAARILDEIEFLVSNHAVEGIYFREDHFTLNAERLRLFCLGIQERQLPIIWACETRIDALNEELIRDMAASGCRAVYLGVESGSQRILDLVRKGIRTADIERVVGWLKQNGITVYCSFIAAVPGETPWDLFKTKRMIRRMKPDAYSFGVFVGIPGSEMYKDVVNAGQYEYTDNRGLLYLNGFHIKSLYFYGQSSLDFVDYKFKKIGFYDCCLLPLLVIRKINYIFKKICRIGIRTICGKS